MTILPISVDRRSDPNSVGCNKFFVILGRGCFNSLWRLVSIDMMHFVNIWI